MSSLFVSVVYGISSIFCYGARTSCGAAGAIHLGSGLESWAEPSDMASFIFWLREWDSDEIHRLSDIALALSRNWQDRQKAGAFVAAAVFFVARLTSDLDEVSAA